jgi:hypothetical protein
MIARMRSRAHWAHLFAIVCLSLATCCHAQALVHAESLCKSAIAGAEAEQRIPDAFLSAIAKVESGRNVNGVIVPWPWTINAEGVGSFFATKEDAIAAVQALQARGVHSIDVGCMQVNLQQHPEAFHALDQAFDPVTNARFAAGLLLTLFGQTGSWPLAAAAYHSQTPTLGAAYQRQVLAAWAEPDRPGAPGRAGHGGNAGAPSEAAGSGAAVSSPPMVTAFGHQGAFLTAQQPRPGIVHGNGRSLADYRLMPTQLALRPPGRPG